jgi:hypothetical protein
MHRPPVFCQTVDGFGGASDYRRLHSKLHLGWLRQRVGGKSEIAMSASWLATKSISQLKAADMKP